MIHKIENLVSIGKYRNYTAVGQVNFHKLTLIYGDNGGGKTTLTAVLRSLAGNNPTLIRNRKSTNSTANQAAQIVYRNGVDTHHTFHHTNGWNTPIPDIEIFDIHFIHDNIYSGYEIKEDHKRQLHQFVIGAQGVAIQQQMELNKRERATIKQNQLGINLQIIEAVANGLTNELLPTFISMSATESENITERITAAEIVLNNAHANALIQRLPVLERLNEIRPGINFQLLEEDLQSTTNTIQDSVLRDLFEEHCTDLRTSSIPNPENWLQVGFNYIATNITNNVNELSCPFCKQEIDNTMDLIRAYTLRFNTAFNDLINRLNGYINLMRNFNLDFEIQALTNVNVINTSRITAWSAHLPATITPPTYNIFNDEQGFRDQFQRVIDLIQQKIQNPSVALDIAPITEFRNSGRVVHQNIVSYNQTVATYNAGISTFKANIQTVEQAQGEVRRLKRIQKRFEAGIDNLCNQINVSTTRLRQLETDYRNLTTQQEAASTTFFDSYKDRVNHYLTTEFRTLFRIEDVRHIAPQGRGLQSKLGYKLTIDGKDISFESNQPLSTKECLSEGDKSTIALAFFLSKLDLDNTRNNKILVFDDPLSSLDTNRRNYTISIIKRLLREMKQVVVLSHNEYFLHELTKDVTAADLKTLRITENFAAKESKIEVCDLEELVKHEYFKQIESLERFRTNPDINIKDTILGYLRTVIETHLRFKFYTLVRTMTRMKTFGNLITHLNANNAVFTDNANRASVIAKLEEINNISWRPHHGNDTPEPNFAALGYNPATITAPELDNLVQDTLDLINRRL